MLCHLHHPCFTVQECVYEKVDVKTKLFSELGEMVSKGVTVASSSGNFPPSTFTEHMSNRDQAMVIHPVRLLYSRNICN